MHYWRAFYIVRCTLLCDVFSAACKILKYSSHVSISGHKSHVRVHVPVYIHPHRTDTHYILKLPAVRPVRRESHFKLIPPCNLARPALNLICPQTTWKKKAERNSGRKIAAGRLLLYTTQGTASPIPCFPTMRMAPRRRHAEKQGMLKKRKVCLLFIQLAWWMV
jgi:hypothetical protein